MNVYEGAAMNDLPIRWCAIGDSFTYLNDHLDETGYRLHRGYLSRILDKLPEYPLELINVGINGSSFRDWITQSIPEADIYTVLLGTNDWHQGRPVGSETDLKKRNAGTILGCLGILTDRIRSVSPDAPVIGANPVERADFVYLLDPFNHARGSYAPENGVLLKDLSRDILSAYKTLGAEPLDLWGLSGFTQNKLVRFKRVLRNGVYEDLPYPDYIDIPFDPRTDEYPYPPEAVFLTYDGLHPSDEGSEILAKLFAERFRRIIGQRKERK